MSTDLLYLSDSYQKRATAKVLEIGELQNQTFVILDQTIFYAQGGGQPADHGTITGPQGQLEVSHVSYNGGQIQHKGKLSGELHVGDTVELAIDWPLRYTHMQLHTAGHVLDQAVKNVIPGIIGLDGNHGINGKNYVEFDQEITADHLPAIQQELDAVQMAALPISTEMTTKEELEERRVRLPFDLPTNKPLRIVQIGEYEPMPDGGTQLKSTAECWPITATQIVVKDGHFRVLYQVTDPAATAESGTATSETKTKPRSATQTADLPDEFTAAVEAIRLTLKTPQVAATTNYFGKKGLFSDVAKQLKELPPESRRSAGQLLNQLKQEIEQTVASYGSNQQTAKVDVTLPGIKPKVGHMHPVSQAIAEITQIFERVGFTRVRYPEADWDWYAFESLNMPKNHPARDEWETFFVAAEPSSTKGKLVLTPHTSSGQVREMERLNSQLPIRMINIARCYRRQQDATHTQMFHQFEGLVVDKGITIQHLKGTLDYFAQEFYGPGTKSRIRPFHFQFTEPSFEVDFSCHICGGTGEVRRDGETAKCRFCKSGWHEVGGAGMVHPNVLKAGGIDPEEYTGFAFGWGVERTYTLKEGLNIDDIRLLYSGELRFLEQF